MINDESVEVIYSAYRNGLLWCSNNDPEEVIKHSKEYDDIRYWQTITTTTITSHTKSWDPFTNSVEVPYELPTE